MVRNRPSPEGREAGANLARFADLAEVEKRRIFPDHAERCRTCAFRSGTVPNGCTPTVLDAIKCVVEQRPFTCHEAEGEPCAGWMLLLDASQPAGKGKVPWPFSDEVEKEAPADLTPLRRREGEAA